MSDNSSNGSGLGGAISLILAVLTGIVGYTINDSRVGIAIVDALFWPIVWCKWLICHDVNMSIIKDSFGFFFK